MSRIKTIYLIRHGECQHNLGEQIFAGSSVDNLLSKVGIETVKKLANEFADKEIDLIIESPLRRSKETALILSKELAVPIIEIPELKEINVGKFAGLTKAKALKKYPKEARSFYSGEIRKWVFPSGESFLELIQRVELLLAKINELPAHNIIVSGHSMFNRLILFYCFPEDRSKWQPTTYPHNRIININIQQDAFLHRNI